MDDLISRQAAINEFCHSCDGWNCNPNTCCKTEWIRKLSVIQPKRGKWIEYEQKFMTDRPFETIKKHVRECSLCRTKIAGFVGTMRYCPNCGAKMEVEHE